MKEMAKPSMHLCVPRTSRSLSPVPQSENSEDDPKLLMRSSSARNSRMERTNSIVVANSKFSITLSPSLSPSQVLTIKRSWKHINTKGLNVVVRRCFQRVRLLLKTAFFIFSSNVFLRPFRRLLVIAN